MLLYGLLVLAISACGKREVAEDSATDAEAPVVGDIPDATDPGPVARIMASPAELARGEALFAGSCAGLCHSYEGHNVDALFLFDCEWKHGESNEEIFEKIKTGIPNTRMVGFGNNFPEGDDDLWRIIAFIRDRQQSCH